MRPIEEIAWDLCSLYYGTKAPINSNGELDYYIVGSLATLPLLCADTIEDIILDDDNRVVSVENPRVIDDNTKSILQQFRRKIGDIDYVAVKSEPDKSGVLKAINNIPDINDISDIGSRVINISDDREQNCRYSLCRLTHNDRSIIVPSPIDMIGYKLSQCVGRKRTIHKLELQEQVEKTVRHIQHNKEKYYEQLKDILPMLKGIINLYSMEQIIERVTEVLASENRLDYELLEEIRKELEDIPVFNELLSNINTKQL